MQLVLVVVFLPSTSANTPLALMVVIATCAGGVFPYRALAHLLMHILQLALCGGGGGACGCIFMSW